MKLLGRAAGLLLAMLALTGCFTIGGGGGSITDGTEILEIVDKFLAAHVDRDEEAMGSLLAREVTLCVRFGDDEPVCPEDPESKTREGAASALVQPFELDDSTDYTVTVVARDFVQENDNAVLTFTLQVDFPAKGASLIPDFSAELRRESGNWLIWKLTVHLEEDLDIED